MGDKNVLGTLDINLQQRAFLKRWRNELLLDVAGANRNAIALIIHKARGALPKLLRASRTERQFAISGPKSNPLDIDMLEAIQCKIGQQFVGRHRIRLISNYSPCASGSDENGGTDPSANIDIGPAFWNQSLNGEDSGRLPFA